MKIIVEGQPKELTDFILNLSQSIVSHDNIIRAIGDKMADTIDSVSHILQEWQ